MHFSASFMGNVSSSFFYHKWMSALEKREHLFARLTANIATSHSNIEEEKDMEDKNLDKDISFMLPISIICSPEDQEKFKTMIEDEGPFTEDEAILCVAKF